MMKKFLIGIGLIFAIPVLYIAIFFMPGYYKVKQLCIDGQLQVFEPINKPTSVYYEKSGCGLPDCVYQIVDKKFTFIEGDIRADGLPKNISKLIKKRSLVRMYAVPRPNDLCAISDAFLTREIEARSRYYSERIETAKAFMTDQCVVIEHVESVESQYRFTYKGRVEEKLSWNTKYRRWTDSIYRNDNNKKVATVSRYAFYYFMNHYIFNSSPHANCRTMLDEGYGKRASALFQLISN